MKMQVQCHVSALGFASTSGRSQKQMNDNRLRATHTSFRAPGNLKNIPSLRATHTGVRAQGDSKIARYVRGLVFLLALAPLCCDTASDDGMLGNVIAPPLPSVPENLRVTFDVSGGATFTSTGVRTHCARAANGCHTYLLQVDTMDNVGGNDTIVTVTTREKSYRGKLFTPLMGGSNYFVQVTMPALKPQPIPAPKPVTKAKANQMQIVNDLTKFRLVKEFHVDIVGRSDQPLVAAHLRKISQKGGWRKVEGGIPHFGSYFRSEFMNSWSTGLPVYTKELSAKGTLKNDQVFALVTPWERRSSYVIEIWTWKAWFKPSRFSYTIAYEHFLSKEEFNQRSETKSPPYFGKKAIWYPYHRDACNKFDYSNRGTPPSNAFVYELNL